MKAILTQFFFILAKLRGKTDYLQANQNDNGDVSIERPFGAHSLENK